MTPVRCEAAADAEIRRLAALAYPEEGCGVLLGRLDAGAPRILRATSAPNLAAHRRHRYELDPGAIVRAEREARAAGIDVVGFWHSHPDHPARASGFDTERAWDEYVYVICAVEAGRAGEVRAHMLDGAGALAALPYEVTPP